MLATLHQLYSQATGQAANLVLTGSGSMQHCTHPQGFSDFTLDFGEYEFRHTVSKGGLPQAAAQQMHTPMQRLQATSL
jgi:hypothetical protein